MKQFTVRVGDVAALLAVDAGYRGVWADHLRADRRSKLTGVVIEDLVRDAATTAALLVEGAYGVHILSYYLNKEYEQGAVVVVHLPDDARAMSQPVNVTGWLDGLTTDPDPAVYAAALLQSVADMASAAVNALSLYPAVQTRTGVNADPFAVTVRIQTRKLFKLLDRQHRHFPWHVDLCDRNRLGITAADLAQLLADAADTGLVISGAVASITVIALDVHGLRDPDAAVLVTYDGGSTTLGAKFNVRSLLESFDPSLLPGDFAIYLLTALGDMATAASDRLGEQLTQHTRHEQPVAAATTAITRTPTRPQP
ncbi:hypothetical protein AB0B66_10595 [Catellatospora sp. NPDC049111]|uniref:hypothetical protein n=1 Tax=Catellatospora sp. NPDC049111 TaxID=3155271 RepID=UPI0033EC2A78